MYARHPQTARLVRLVEEGAIGELRLVRVSFSCPPDAEGDVRLRRELDGGALVDVECDSVGASRLLAGAAGSAWARRGSARVVAALERWARDGRRSLALSVDPRARQQRIVTSGGRGAPQAKRSAGIRQIVQNVATRKSRPPLQTHMSARLKCRIPPAR